MRITAIIAALFAVATMASAQVKELKKSGISAEEMLPEGWTLLASAEEDINHDYIPDLALIALPDNKENIITREDGYVKNMNEPVVAIYFGSGGVYHWWGSSIAIIEPESEFSSLDEVSLSINAKGVLSIGYKMFYSAGSWDVPSHKFVYRYQKYDGMENLFLIGYDSKSFNRATHDEQTISYNFLTSKKQTLITKNGAKAGKEKWEKIAKKELLEFGDNPLDYVSGF